MRSIFILCFVFLSICFGLNIDKNLTIGKLDNGITYYLYKNEIPKNSINMIMHIKAGSSDERDDEQGIAHFVEHMAFNGTRDFEKNDLIKALESLGVKFGADLNAATSFNETTYKLNIKNSDENIQKALKVLANMGFLAKFTEDEVEAEKGVIAQEEKNRRNAYTRISEQNLKYYFKDSIYKDRLPIGKMDVVLNATPKLLRGFYDRYYQPQNTSLVVVGDFDKDMMIKYIKENFNEFKNKSEINFVDKKIGFFNDLVIFNAHDKEINNNSVSLMFESESKPLNSLENLKESFIYDFISRLIFMRNEAQKFNANSVIDINFYPSEFYNQKTLFTFSASVLGNDFNASIDKISSLIKDIKENGFNKNDFLTIKKQLLEENLNILNQTLVSDEIVFNILNLIENKTIFLSKKDRYLINDKFIKNVTLNELEEKFRNLIKSDGVLISLISKNPVFLSKDDFRKIISNSKINNQFSKNLPNSLLDKELKNVDIKSSFYDDKNQIYFYEFENGAKLVFKEVATKKDEIFFKAFKKGGLTNFQDIKNPNFAVDISNGSGIGEFNNYEVGVITAGEIFNFSKFINRISLGYFGSVRSSDLENFFKAFYVDFENPKIDENYLKNYQTLSLDALKKNEENPDYKFAKEFNEFYYKNSLKMKFTSQDDIKNIEISKLRNFLSENFKNAGEYYFVFVGDMKAQDFIKIAKNYIGNLKGFKNSTKILDDNIRGLNKNATFKRFYLSENVAKSSIFIKGQNLDFTPKNYMSLSIATEILNVLMREEIREKHSLTYGIYAYSNLEKLPFNQNYTKISWTCEPKDSDKIVEMVKDRISFLKTKFKDEKELNNIKLIKKVALEKAYEEPSFWLSEITGALLFDTEIYNKQRALNLLNGITLKDVIDVSNIAFDLENLIYSSNSFKELNKHQ
ncbi:insulinase family protein [Campylobacter sp. FMV-PI01]|uniref:Insulinase family protein n=1 Tax=Campylobacter portucalensis TaxID=2608384 RepID=A0A6L5WJ93_9BACT|nr:M16 family metallopeptidase [Campylobacter portucalensis]MSN96085.1 insulinase family protein [Campylobacter portucalensis]